MSDNDDIKDFLLKHADSFVLIDQDTTNNCQQVALKELLTFIRSLQTADIKDKKHSVKYFLSKRDDSTEGEYIWLSPVSICADGTFAGMIDNDPKVALEFAKGDIINFSRDQIVDWLYLQDNEVIGGYSIKAMKKVL